MATDEQLEQIRNQLKIELSNSLRDELENENDDLKTQIVELRQALQMNMPHHEEEDNMDILPYIL